MVVRGVLSEVAGDVWEDSKRAEAENMFVVEVGDRDSFFPFMF